MTLIPTDAERSDSSNFEILREIFWKGDMVVNKQGTRAYRLIGASVVEKAQYPLSKITRYLRLETVYIDFQGDGFVTVEHCEEIPEFSGIKHIRLSIVSIEISSGARKSGTASSGKGAKVSCS